jgi:hypothetical protein
MKTQIHSFAAVLALALSVGLMTGCSQQGVDGKLPGLGKDRPSGKSVPQEIHATLKKDEGSNRTCTTYDHAGSNGSSWRTKWC